MGNSAGLIKKNEMSLFPLEPENAKNIIKKNTETFVCFILLRDSPYYMTSFIPCFCVSR